ncbi:MAG: hypothetical protein K2K12_04490, partial [Clostridia bacterium]|nr:hypothetical protein [Clostridia bacterium]
SQCCAALKTNATAELATFILSQPSVDYGALLYSFIGHEDNPRAKKTVKRALKEADKRERKKK